MISLTLKLRTVSWPSREESLRRLEVKSGLVHRPLESIEDELSQAEAPQGADPETQTLWRAHQQKLHEQIQNLKIGWPKSLMPMLDQRAFRVLIALGLVVAIALTGEDWQDRLAQGVQPSMQQQEDVPITIDAWVDPPAYTGKAPVFLTRTTTAAPLPSILKVPSGSNLIIRSTGRKNAPSIALSALGVDDEAEDTVAGAFEEIADQTFEYTTVLDRDVEVAVQDGRQALASWSFRAVPDNPPAITFAQEVSESKRQALVIPYALVDDYGAVSAVAEIRLAQKPVPSDPGSESDAPDRFDVTGEPEDAEPEILRFNVENRPPISLEIILPSLQTRRASGELNEDLTAHPWAGLDVTIELKAEDELGQVGLSEQITYTLPERVFTDALAKAVIEQRKWLAQYPQDGARVARFIEAFTAAPERYFQDMGAYLFVAQCLLQTASSVYGRRAGGALPIALGYCCAIGRGAICSWRPTWSATYKNNWPRPWPIKVPKMKSTRSWMPCARRSSNIWPLSHVKAWKTCNAAIFRVWISKVNRVVIRWKIYCRPWKIGCVLEIWMAPAMRWRN